MKEDFLRAETREDFAVSAARKKLWAIQLDLLSQLHELCRGHHLRYYAANGTLLGAVKYRGFIPWDDDLDVMMPRPDYEILAALARERLRYPYYFQDADGEGSYYRPYGRIRYAASTAISPMDLDRQDVSGIFIDIFPVNGVEEKRMARQLRRVVRWDKFALAYVYPREVGTGLRGAVKTAIARTLVGMFSYPWLLERLRAAFAERPYAEADWVFLYTHGSPVLLEKRAFDGTMTFPFEYAEIPVPPGYDVILRRLYGDYMHELPPAEERGTRHRLFIDPDRPYSFYKGKLDREYAAGRGKEL